MNSHLTVDQYCLFFHTNICHVCKGIEHLKRCAQCKSVAYCSKDHQKVDWKHHKDFCSALTRVNNECSFIELTNFDEFLTVKKLKYRLLCKYLNRDLSDYEHQIWMFPRICEICYTSDVHIECEKCRSVFFCSEDHKHKFQSKHENYCKSFKLNLEIGLYPIFNDVDVVEIEANTISSDVLILPSTLEELTNLYDKKFSKGDFMTKIRKYNCLSPVATILYGLEKIGIVSNRKIEKDMLNIHFVGGDMYEIGRLWLHMAELIFHWIENLNSLDFIVIGPDLNHNGTTDKFTFQLCSACKNRKCKTTVTFHTQLYHNMVTHLKKPDVVVAYNSGIHANKVENFLSENDNLPEYLWRESVEYLVLNKNIPLILTAYILEEIRKDIKEVKNHAKTEVKVLVDPHRNPFSDRKPCRQFESQEDPLFFINGYMAVVAQV
ncbi:uncharacterized protein [Diabrotica undecimpunctata]|uniref:uncharacterized protein n=1 Tax=Diabrotica undecimpunctata TaxID=50387 RepID=UPI003B637229